MAKVLTELARELHRFAETLQLIGDFPAFAVIGGLAVSVRTAPRFTRDVDLAVAAATDTEAEALVGHLLSCGYRTFAVLEHRNGRLATVRLIPPGGSEEGVLVGLLFASSGIEREIVESAQRIEVLPGATLPVASLGHLLALKLLSVGPDRPNDAADLAALRREATPIDIAVCRESVALIEARGFARGRDLAAAMAEVGLGGLGG